MYYSRGAEIIKVFYLIKLDRGTFLISRYLKLLHLKQKIFN